MNRGVLQGSPVQQMMAAGNPNWWSINNMRPPPILTTTHLHQQVSASPFLPPPFPDQFLYQYAQPQSSVDDDASPPSNSSSNNSSSLSVPFAWSNHDSPDQFPESWSQLLLGGFVGDEDRGNMGHFQVRKIENWEDQVAALHHHHQAAASSANNSAVEGDVKQEGSPPNSYVYGHASKEFNNQATWSSPPPMLPLAATISSPTSCVTSFNGTKNNNMVDFSAINNKADPRHPPPDRSSYCSINANGGALKKARIQPSTNQQPICKVRKEKLGDRITTLHQIVSPFGKTDTASVLLEAIGYIRFLQNQIEALSLPYLGSESSNMRQQHSVPGERNSLFPEDPGQLLNEKSSKQSGTYEKDHEQGPKKDLRSRGLCLVPVSCTLQVGSDNGADYWAPAFGGGFR